MADVNFKTVAECLQVRDRLGHFQPPYKIGSCPKRNSNGCTGSYTTQVPETPNERMGRALRTLADQVEAGGWDDVDNVMEVAGARIDRIYRAAVAHLGAEHSADIAVANNGKVQP